MEQKSQRNYKYVENPDMFVAGSSGSGKDTFSNYIKDYYGYRKMRIAQTIKMVICERHDLTFDQLEELKRDNPELRLEHQTVAAQIYPDNYGSLNRCKQLAMRQALDYDMVSDPEKEIIVTDVRSYEEAKTFLDLTGSTGLFLTKVPQEFTNDHWTDRTMFGTVTDREGNKHIPVKTLIQEFPGQCVIVNNGCMDLTNILEGLDDYILISFDTPPNASEFLDKIQNELLEKLIEKE